MRRLLLWIAAAAIVALTGTNGYSQSTDYTRDTPGLWQDWSGRRYKSNELWKESDNCGLESFKKFSDYTVEGGLNRDAFMRQCLRSHHAPPRADLVQPAQPKQ
jgi:hypothetical protein